MKCIDVALERAYRTGLFRREALGVKARILLKLGHGEELSRVLEQIMSMQMIKGVPDVGRELMQQAGVRINRTATGLAPRAPPAGWTWHHALDPGVMQLVPFAQHAPGTIFQNVLHPGRKGGYAIWGEP